MRYVKMLPWLLAALLFIAGCVTQEPQPTVPVEKEEEAEKERETEKEEEKEAPEKKVKEKEPEEPKYEMREVTEEVEVVKRKLTYFARGVLDRYRVYTYPDEAARVLDEKLYNSEDKLQERVEYRYENGNPAEKAVYDGAGDLQRRHVYSYDDAARLTEDALYNASEELQSRSVYTYDEEGNKVEWRVYDGSGGLLSYTKYIYENGRNTRIENYRPGGAVEDYFVNEFDKKGRKVRSTWYDSSDEVVQYRTFSYEGGALAEEVVHRANGSVKLRIIYTNNDAGNPVKVRYEEADGDVREIINYEYVTRTEARMEKKKISDN